MTKPAFTLSRDGYFTRRGRRLVPVGVNYWPASCGVEMWREWPADEIQHDLDTMRALQLNCVRFFVRWQDFEPRPGRYRRVAFDRLAQFLAWCHSRDLLAHPSLFVGWMSGGIFWPAWKGRRNLFADPFMRRRAIALAGRVARTCARFRADVLAIDQGNEICCLPDCLEVLPADVARWCGGVNAAIRRAFPGVLLVSGNDQNQVAADNGWRLGAQPGCDFYSMHTYPHRGWHPLGIDGMTDPLGQSLFPFYLKCARAFGPVLAQEFGTIFTAGPCADAYLRAVLPAAWAAGANGFLWWSLRDFSARGHPYNKNAFECLLGLVGDDNRIKPHLRFLAEFVATLPQRAAPSPDEADVALYWPRHYYLRDDPLNPGNDPPALSRRLIIAHFALGELGHRVGIVRGDLPLRAIGARTVVITGASLTADEAAALAAWVEAGGRLIWHGVDVATCGPDAGRLLGAEAVDLRAPRAAGIAAFGATWEFREFARDVLAEVHPRGAEVIAADSQRRPILLRHRLGHGTIAACLAQPDDQFAARSEDLADRSRWLTWYRGMLELVDRPEGETAPARGHGTE